MKKFIKCYVLVTGLCMSIPAMAEGSCRPINGFQPKDNHCVRQGITYLAPTQDGSASVIKVSRDEAVAACKGMDLVVASLKQYSNFFGAGGFEAMDLPIDELYWTRSTSEDALMYFPGQETPLAVDLEIKGSVLCVGGGLNFIPITGQGFAMQETEVTRGQWKALMGYYPECYSEESDDYPVTCITAEEAEQFGRAMTRRENDGHTYRLPSEQEWSVAAGNIGGSDYGWCGWGIVHPVKEGKAHNGLYDMVGNVSEWTSSNYEYDPLFKQYYRVHIGSSSYDRVANCHASNRGKWFPFQKSVAIGFRLLKKP